MLLLARTSVYCSLVLFMFLCTYWLLQCAGGHIM